jgi:hypothetical protein
VPLLNWIAVGSTPNIYHLIEQQDMYHRYVMILCAEKGVRIFAINVDAWTEELWTTQPELRRRVGSVWAKEQYRSHRFGLTNDSTNEEAMILDQIMSGGGQRSFPRSKATQRRTVEPSGSYPQLDRDTEAVDNPLSAAVAADEP